MGLAKSNYEEAIFIDDNPRNCDGAKKLDINMIVHVRNEKKKVSTEHIRISSLKEVLDLLNIE